MTGVCLFVCVVGPGFDSTSTVFVRSRASHAAGSNDRLAQKRNRAPIYGGRDCVATICADVSSSPTSCRLCLLGPRYRYIRYRRYRSIFVTVIVVTITITITVNITITMLLLCCCSLPTPPCLFGGVLPYFEVTGHPVPVPH